MVALVDLSLGKLGKTLLRTVPDIVDAEVNCFLCVCVLLFFSGKEMANCSISLRIRMVLSSKTCFTVSNVQPPFMKLSVPSAWSPPGLLTDLLHCKAKCNHHPWNHLYQLYGCIQVYWQTYFTVKQSTITIHEDYTICMVTFKLTDRSLLILLKQPCFSNLQLPALERSHIDSTCDYSYLCNRWAWLPLASFHPCLTNKHELHLPVSG